VDGPGEMLSNHDLKHLEPSMTFVRIAVRLALVLLLASCGGSSGPPTPETATWDTSGTWNTSTWE